MMDENVNADFMRWIAAELRCLCEMTASREMFGKSYFSLGAGEKDAVLRAVHGMVEANYRRLTPEYLQRLRNGDI